MFSGRNVLVAGAGVTESEALAESWPPEHPPSARAASRERAIAAGRERCIIETPWFPGGEVAGSGIDGGGALVDGER